MKGAKKEKIIKFVSEITMVIIFTIYIINSGENAVKSRYIYANFYKHFDQPKTI